MIISTGLKDCSHLKIVPVISSFDCDGHIIPLYIRINDESLRVYNVTQSDSTFRLLVFHCDILIDDTFLPLTLLYHINDILWSIPIHS